MFKKLLFIAFIALSVMSCEEPVHEEYDLYGNSNDTNDGNGSWLPLTNSNQWNYSGLDESGNYTYQVNVEGTEVFDNKTFYKIHYHTVSSSETTDEYSHMRWDNNTLETRTLPEVYGVAEGYTASPIYLHPLKNDMTVGQTWSDTFSIDIHFTTIDMSFTINYTINYLFEQHFDTYVVNGTVYNDVAKLKITTGYVEPISGVNVATIEYDYFAKNIGIIKSTLSENGVSMAQMNITSYTIH